MIELLCSDGNVKNLYVCILSIDNGVTVVFHLQGRHRQSIERDDFLVDWAVDVTYEIVR